MHRPSGHYPLTLDVGRVDQTADCAVHAKADDSAYYEGLSGSLDYHQVADLAASKPGYLDCPCYGSGDHAFACYSFGPGLCPGIRGRSSGVSVAVTALLSRVLAVEAVSSYQPELHLWLLVMEQALYGIAANAADFAAYSAIVADKNHCTLGEEGQTSRGPLDHSRDSDCNHAACHDLAVTCLVVAQDMIARGEARRIE